MAAKAIGQIPFKSFEFKTSLVANVESGEPEQIRQEVTEFYFNSEYVSVKHPYCEIEEFEIVDYLHYFDEDGHEIMDFFLVAQGIDWEFEMIVDRTDSSVLYMYQYKYFLYVQ